MYFARLGSGNLVYRLGSLVHHLGNLDYIPPAFCPEDLRSIRPPEWQQLVQDLVEYSAYDVIVLDIGTAVNGILEILKICGRIFMPVREDCVSIAKLEQFEKVLRQQNAPEILDKTRKLKLPFHSSFGTGKAYVEQLIWGELGDYVRKLIREETDERLGTGRTETAKKASGAAGSGQEAKDQEIYRQIDDLILEEGRKRYLSLQRKGELRTELFNSVRKLDILQELIDDDSVTEIMVNGTEGIFLERGGRLFRWEKRISSREKLEDMVQQIAGRCNRIVNEAVPVADARLEDGSRVNLVLPPVALNGPVITIRRFPNHPIRMERLMELEAVTREAVDFLASLVRSGYNIFISGGTGSGKTTFLNALSDYIPKDERIITIEDNAELQIQGVANLVRLEARRANTEGKNSVTIRDLIKASLRMRPDRIVVGEVRGEEALDMIQAMNTGHDGSLSTGHGNSPRDMLSRLETMVLMGMELPLPAIRRQIASAVDVMIHLGRMRDRSRKVLEILEIIGYDESGERWRRTHSSHWRRRRSIPWGFW